MGDKIIQRVDGENDPLLSDNLSDIMQSMAKVTTDLTHGSYFSMYSFVNQKASKC